MSKKRTTTLKNTRSLHLQVESLETSPLNFIWLNSLLVSFSYDHDLKHLKENSTIMNLYCTCGWDPSWPPLLTPTPLIPSRAPPTPSHPQTSPLNNLPFLNSTKSWEWWPLLEECNDPAAETNRAVWVTAAPSSTGLVWPDRGGRGGVEGKKSILGRSGFPSAHPGTLVVGRLYAVCTLAETHFTFWKNTFFNSNQFKSHNWIKMAFLRVPGPSGGGWSSVAFGNRCKIINRRCKIIDINVKKNRCKIINWRCR